MSGVRRRDFIAFLGGAATIVWSLASRAQQAKAPRIGVLVLGAPDPEQFLRGLREGLHKVGYIEDQNIRLEVRSAGGKASLLPEAAGDLVALKVDIIVAWQTLATQAAKQATNEIPIVMVGVGVDPVEMGLIDSLARPGGNITGMSGAGPPFIGKVVELIRELLPSARRVAILANPTASFTKPFLAQIELAAGTMGLDIVPIMHSDGEEFEAAFAEMRRKQVDAVIIQPSVLRKSAVDLALRHRLPSFSVVRQFPEIGGLMSYHPTLTDVLGEAALYVNKILKGSRPADLPVGQPSKFALVINIKTAKALGITIPPSLLARADEVIE